MAINLVTTSVHFDSVAARWRFKTSIFSFLPEIEIVRTLVRDAVKIVETQDCVMQNCKFPAVELGSSCISRTCSRQIRVKMGVCSMPDDPPAAALLS